MPQSETLLKKRLWPLAQVFPCEFSEISKYTFFTEHLWATATVMDRYVMRTFRVVIISEQQRPDCKKKEFHVFMNLDKVVGASTAQKMKFFIKDFFSKCDQIRGYLRIWSFFVQ